MTLVTIDLGDVAGGYHPDDHVIVRAENFRESPGGGITSTAEVKIPLVEGVGQAEVEPGPVVVAFRCQAVADTREKRGVVPSSGTVGIEDVIAGAFEYTPAVVNRGLDQIEGARDEALGQVAVAVAGAVAAEVGEAIDAATSSAAAAAASADRADFRAATAETKVDAYTPRVEALEAMNGVSPESPVDGQTANLVAQPGTLTHAAIFGQFAESPPGSGLFSVPGGDN